MQIGDIVTYHTMEGLSRPAFVRRVWKDGTINLSYVDPEEKHQHGFGRNLVDKATVKEGQDAGQFQRRS